MGAPFPVATNSAALRSRDPNHWVFQPPVNPPVPQSANAARANGPLDRFVVAKLEAAQLEPAQPVSPRTLIRRATFDLTGLQPTPSALRRTIQHGDEQCLERGQVSATELADRVEVGHVLANDHPADHVLFALRHDPPRRDCSRGATVRRSVGLCCPVAPRL